ncbi:GntR family transcriptional regulator [Streptomyces tendae]|uniref:GntR family transcriptional regulator n=1 Tax=Streptomyces tendae TaxID=1932 RepID=UPI0037BCC88C
MPETPERTALYRLYDASGRLLYIGITTEPKARFASHATYKSWWPQVTRKDVSWLEGTWRQALAVEAAAIQDEKPQFNGKHNAPLAPFSAESWSTIDAPPRGKAAALADLVRAEITSGRWLPGMRVPRREDLAAASGVGVGTADLAYRNLEKEGLVRSLHGRGTFVT